MSGDWEVRVPVVIKTTVNVSVEDVIIEINKASMVKRWNIVAKLLNGIDVESGELSEAQKGVVLNYLKTALERFEGA